MEVYSILVKMLVGVFVSLFVGYYDSYFPIKPKTIGAKTEQLLLANSKPNCKTGFKPGKTPISLAPGAKVSCVNVKSAALGKQLLTGTSNICFTCHSTSGPYPVTQMLLNLKNQGYNLKPAQIFVAFNEHSALMSGATITSKDSKNIASYLQTLKIPK